MLESIILIGAAAVAVLVLLNFLSSRAKHRDVVDPDSLNAELKHLAHGRKHAQDHPTTFIENSASDFLGIQDTRAREEKVQQETLARERKAQIALAEAETNARTFPQIKPSLRPTPSTPDEIYLMDAKMADVNSGAAFREFAREKYTPGHYPMPDAEQMDRIVAEVDAIAKKKAEFVLTSPVAVIRKARAVTDVTKISTSWLGGRPMLGTAPWPRTSGGVPMHHWASVDLADLTQFEVPTDLPKHGYFVFFVHAIDTPYEGKVLYISDGDTPSVPPDDLPIIDHDSKFMNDQSDYTKADAPTEHLHWAIEFMSLPMDRSKEEYAAARQLLADTFPDTSNFNLSAQSLAKIYLDMSGQILWDSVRRYAEKMSNAQSSFKGAITQAQHRVDMGETGAVETFDYLQVCLAELQAFVGKVQAWAAPKDQWALLNAADKAQLATFRAWRLPDSGDLGLQAGYAVRSANQYAENIKDDVRATVQFLAENWDRLDDPVPQDVRQVVTVYRDILEPFLWDTAKRCAEKIVLADTHLDETLKSARTDVEAFKDGAEERLAYLVAHTGELRAFIRDFQHWVAPHDAWTRIGEDDKVKLNAFMSRIAYSMDPDFGLGEYYRHNKMRVAQISLQAACDVTLRTVARGEENLYQLLPQSVKDLLDSAHRLPDRFELHQMFGEGVCRQTAREDHPYDHLLLQLVPDHMMMGAWDGGGVVQFWISPEDLRRQNWEAVTVTMESD